MKNFGRALCLAFQYRLTVVATLMSALVVALFWAGNITAVYPVVQVVLNNQSVPELVVEKIDHAERNITDFTKDVQQLERQLAAAPLGNPKKGDQEEGDRNDIRSQLQRKTARIEAEQKALAWYRWIQPYADHMPNDTFQTLLVICGALLLGTVIKNLFLILSTILAARVALLTTFPLMCIDPAQPVPLFSMRLVIFEFSSNATLLIMAIFSHVRLLASARLIHAAAACPLFATQFTK